MALKELTARLKSEPDPEDEVAHQHMLYLEVLRGRPLELPDFVREAERRRGPADGPAKASLDAALGVELR